MRGITKCKCTTCSFMRVEGGFFRNDLRNAEAALTATKPFFFGRNDDPRAGINILFLLLFIAAHARPAIVPVRCVRDAHPRPETASQHRSRRQSPDDLPRLGAERNELCDAATAPSPTRRSQ